MISASDAQEYEPYGRQVCTVHPGSTFLQVRGHNQGDHGLPLVKALQDISIREDQKKDSWQVRKLGHNKVTCDEELYVNDHIVVWSRGNLDGAAQVIKTFTMDSSVQDAMWCSFLLPKEVPANGNGNSTEVLTVPSETQRGVCVVESSVVSIYTTDGRDYRTALPFQVSRTWPVLNGLLFERITTPKAVDISKTPRKDQQQSRLPVLFSMLHPLDEVTPVICRTGGSSSSAKVSYVTETSQQIVFSSDIPSLVMTYDRLISTHSVWMVRKARLEEAFKVFGNYLGGDAAGASSDLLMPDPVLTPGVSHSHSNQGSASMSRLTLSSQSPSISPFRSFSSKLNSPSVPNSRVNSPSLSRLATFSRSQSPSLLSAGLSRLQANQSPSPFGRSSSPRFARSPLSLNTSYTELPPSDARDPLAPEVCFDHLWTETGVPRDGPSGKTSKVFLTFDMCGRHFICYLIPYRHHLRCVKFEESNDRSQLIFGSLCTIKARDAVPLPSLNMMVVVDMESNLLLYSGTVKMNRIHVGGLPTLMTSSSMRLPPRPSSPFSSPSRRISGGPVTSSRPPSAMDARFDEEVQMLSPVPTEFNDSSQLLDTSLTDDLSFQAGGTPRRNPGAISAVRDSVDNRFTLELVDGTLYRSSLPPVSQSPIISTCLEAIRLVLPRDTALQVLVKWYCTNNAPGSVNGQSDWLQFASCLLGMMGYDINKLPLTQQAELNCSMSPVIAAKKAKPSDIGSDKEWEYLLTSDHHLKVSQCQGHILGLTDVQSEAGSRSPSPGIIDTTAVLFQHIPAILFALHLVYEELKLDTLFGSEIHQLASLLHQLANDLHLPLYSDHYCRDHPTMFCLPQYFSQVQEENLHQMQYPNFLLKEPPNIHQWLFSFLKKQDCPQFPFLPGVSQRTMNVIAMYVGMFEDDISEVAWSKYLRKVAAVGHRCPDFEVDLAKGFTEGHTADPHQRVVLFMTHLALPEKTCLTCGVSLPLMEAISHCKQSPPGDWPEQAYHLIGREDFARQKRQQQQVQRAVTPSKDSASQVKGVKDEEDGMEYLDKELLKLRFSQDLRIEEVRRLLQSSRPVRISLTQRPEVSDHEFIEEQERHLYATCIRTMALPLGRGMFTMSTYHPVPTETLPIPKLCLTGRASPRNTTVDLSHIDTPANMNHWPQFHNGVAAGLRIADRSQLDSTWILYNKPKSNDLTNEHAGFLMGLGLNGHLAQLATLNVHDYLCIGHEMTSVGLLLGISAGKRGTMDVATTRMLSIHLAALLPPTSTELEVPHNVQVAAILGVGLLYQGTAHRHIAEILLSEIGRPPGPEMENCTDRESYSLASGLALGMVMLGKGSEVLGLSDLSMADELYHYMVGGHKRPLSGAYKERYKSPSYQIKEGDSVNVDVTTPGATLALGMMFFQTGNSAVAEWLAAPDTQFLLDFVRPDFLMLRVISRGLVLWDQIHPSEDWVDSNLPEIVAKYAFQKSKYQDDPNCDIDFETMSQASCNIIAGACMAMGLKFAGSANEEAFDSLYAINKRMLDLLAKPQMVIQSGKSTIESCLIVSTLSLAMVMAGTGNLDVVRLCRYLRARVGPAYSYVLYGSHMAISMSLGLLFLGGGRFSLSTRPEAIAAMLCAFFPKFPIHSNDNRCHLQAFRHLYVLASEPRVLLPRDVDSGVTCYVPVKVRFKGTEAYKSQEFSILAPCVLPQLDLLDELKIEGPRYWPITFQADKNWDMLREILHGTGYLYVKQRAGHLSYAADPKGYHSVFSQSLTSGQSVGKVVKPEDIQSFSSDPRILAFAEYFCSTSTQQEYEMVQFLSRVLYECVSLEKLEVLPTYIALHKAVKSLSSQCQTQQIWQLKLMLAFYERMASKQQLISQEFLTALRSTVESTLQNWLQDCGDALVNYLSGQRLTQQQCHLVAAFLVWYQIPHPRQLTSLQLGGKASFPELYKQLHPTGISVRAAMSLANALGSKTPEKSGQSLGR